MSNKNFCLRTNIRKLVEYSLRNPENPNATMRENLIRIAKLNVIMLGAYLGSFNFALWIKGVKQDRDGTMRPVTWRTPVMFGNAGRNPIFPYEELPFHRDFEEIIKFYRAFDLRAMELILWHPVMLHSRVYHPQREDLYDMTIYDAEYQRDILKRLDEQRHEMAIKCVQLGIYENVI